MKLIIGVEPGLEASLETEVSITTVIIFESVGIGVESGTTAVPNGDEEVPNSEVGATSVGVGVGATSVGVGVGVGAKIKVIVVIDFSWSICVFDEIVVVTPFIVVVV
jgi:hypothetical protein